MVVILSGAAGDGTTTIGRALATRHGWRFVDAGEQHTAAAVATVHNGVPLTDADRAPWLAALYQLAAAALDRREPLVLACPALTHRSRDMLRGGLRTVRFVYLTAGEETLTRLSDRAGHVAGPALLASQLGDLEEPSDALTVDATRPPDQIVNEISYELGL